MGKRALPNPAVSDVENRKQEANELDLEAACHLERAVAVTDLIDILAAHDMLEEVRKGTLISAMSDIRFNIEASRKLNLRIWNLSWREGVTNG